MLADLALNALNVAKLPIMMPKELNSFQLMVTHKAYLSMDKLQLRGQNHGCLFNSGSERACLCRAVTLIA
jgi:hypothetical protein